MRVGVNMEENWKMLQSWIIDGRASWGKSEKKEEVALIADRKRKSELGKKWWNGESSPINEAR